LKNARTNFTLARCSWDAPAPTLVIAGQKPNGLSGAIHPEVDRKFTIPELKRLFGLPEDYQLTGTIEQAVECICNMVPPLLAKEVAESVYEGVLRPYREATGG
jgi:site-specific DNA-cytosine methylase